MNVPRTLPQPTSSAPLDLPLMSEQDPGGSADMEFAPAAGPTSVGTPAPPTDPVQDPALAERAETRTALPPAPTNAVPLPAAAALPAAVSASKSPARPPAQAPTKPKQASSVSPQSQVPHAGAGTARPPRQLFVGSPPSASAQPTATPSSGGGAAPPSTPTTADAAQSHAQTDSASSTSSSSSTGTTSDTTTPPLTSVSSNPPAPPSVPAATAADDTPVYDFNEGKLFYACVRALLDPSPAYASAILSATIAKVGTENVLGACHTGMGYLVSLSSSDAVSSLCASPVTIREVAHQFFPGTNPNGLHIRATGTPFLATEQQLFQIFSSANLGTVFQISKGFHSVDGAQIPNGVCDFILLPTVKRIPSKITIRTVVGDRNISLFVQKPPLTQKPTRLQWSGEQPRSAPAPTFSFSSGAPSSSSTSSTRLTRSSRSTKTNPTWPTPAQSASLSSGAPRPSATSSAHLPSLPDLADGEDGFQLASRKRKNAQRHSSHTIPTRSSSSPPSHGAPPASVSLTLTNRFSSLSSEEATSAPMQFDLSPERGAVRVVLPPSDLSAGGDGGPSGA